MGTEQTTGGGLSDADLVWNVVYVSRAANEAWTDDELEALAVSSRAKNAALGIRGILVVLDGFFIQWLQGPKAELDALIRRIAHDTRRRSFCIVHRASAQARLPALWIMLRATRTESQAALARRVSLLGASPDAASDTVAPERWISQFTLPAIDW